MLENISIVCFFAGLGFFIWFVLRLTHQRQEAWKKLAGEFARRYGVAAGRAINDWTHDTQVFEWEEGGLKVAVAGGSNAVMVPGSHMAAVVTSAKIHAAFAAPAGFTFVIRRNGEESEKPEQLARLVADPALRAALNALFDSSIRNGVLDQNGLTVSFYDQDDFRDHAADVLPAAKLAAARLKTL